jgi:branched-chain amino acid transport system ATP-binding protein
MLRLENVSKTFGSLVVSNAVTLEVTPGQRHTIIGPNGAGKTTLINQIGGQLSQDSGKIFLQGKDITQLSAPLRARAGLARTFQKNTLFQALSVFENVRLGAQAAHGKTYDIFRSWRSDMRVLALAEQAIEQMNLGRIAAQPVRELSYGDLRQVEVAVALATSPTVLLLDEPTSGLSPSETAQMIDVLCALPREISILMIEHDMEVVFSIADHITVLYYGEVIASGAPRTVADDPRVQDVYLGAPQ